MAVDKNQISHRSDFGEVTFADAGACDLLKDHLPELCHPNGQWQQVKRNSARSVYRGSIGGQEVYLKHFHGRSLSHRIRRLFGYSHARHEMAIAGYLNAHGVRSTPVLAAMCDGGIQWLASQSVGAAVAGDLWHSRQLAAGNAGQRSINHALLALADMVAHMHRAGVIHSDLHCGNIMVAQSGSAVELTLMDLHRAYRRRYLSRRARAANLAQLMHDRFESTTRTQRLRFLKRYLQVSQTSGSLDGWQRMVESFAHRHRRRIFASSDKRIFGDNRYFSPISLPGGWRGNVVLASKYKLGISEAAQNEFTLQNWRSALGNVEALMSGPDAKVVKDSRSGKVVHNRLRVGGQELDVFVKRPRRKAGWKILIDCFRPCRPMRAFDLGHRLLARYVATPLPLVCLQRRVGPFLADSILITETAHGALLHDFLNTWLSADAGQDGALTAGQRRQLTKEVLWQMGRLLQRLHDNNLAHRDLKETNMIVSWSPGEPPEVVLLDLDGLRRCARISTRRRFQGLMRLNVSLLKCPSVSHAGRLRMLLGYLRRPGSGRINFKPYWRVLEQWSARKLNSQIKSARRRQKAVRRPAP